MKLIKNLKINISGWTMTNLVGFNAACLKSVEDDERHFVNRIFPYPYSPILWKIRKDITI